MAALATLWFVHLLAVMSPGPSLVVVARSAIAGSRTRGMWVALGLGLGTLVWSLAAMFGLNALFALAPWLYTGIKVAGAIFLLYIAVMMWRHARDPVPTGETMGSDSEDRPDLLKRPGAAVRLGLLTQLSNPKVAVFFGSIFVTLLPAAPSPAVQAAVIAILCLNEVAWYTAVAYAFGVQRLRRGYARAKAWIDRTCGGFLTLLGLRLVLDVR
ncbi:LysE family transporter [Rhodovibrio salinarum]|uniref:LysE family translocator n=1 Tax=Rhodovibrio salinarum TaxID=1087 RepID=UPI001905AC10